MDETFEEMSRIAAKFNHLEGTLTSKSLADEAAAIQNLGFEPIKQDEELSPLMLTMMTALEQFKLHIPRCIALGKAEEDEGRFEVRYFIPREYQLDHSVVVRAAIDSTKTIVKRIAPKSEATVSYNSDSISISFTGV
jgi:hypothetical protein